VIPFVAGNKMNAGTYGTELFTDWKVFPKWRLLGSYSYLQMNLRKNADSLDPNPESLGLTSPRHQFYVRSSVDLLRNVEHDFVVRFVDRLAGLPIPSYYSLDTRLTWRTRLGPELSVGGQNLLNKRHLEFIPDFINTSPTEVRRSFYGSITWRFE
jgi:iron complex outermembrane receptor protein